MDVPEKVKILLMIEGLRAKGLTLRPTKWGDHARAHRFRQAVLTDPHVHAHLGTLDLDLHEGTALFHLLDARQRQVGDATCCFSVMILRVRHGPCRHGLGLVFCLTSWSAFPRIMAMVRPLGGPAL